MGSIFVLLAFCPDSAKIEASGSDRRHKPLITSKEKNKGRERERERERERDEREREREIGRRS